MVNSSYFKNPQNVAYYPSSGVIQKINIEIPGVFHRYFLTLYCPCKLGNLFVFRKGSMININGTKSVPLFSIGYLRDRSKD